MKSFKQFTVNEARGTRTPLRDKPMTDAQKKKFDVLYKKYHGGREHKIFRQTAHDMIGADDMFHAFVKTLAMKEQVAEARQLKNPKTEVMVVDNAGKTIVIDKTKQKEYLAKGWKLAESVNEITTPMRNRFGPAVDSKKFDAYKKHMKANKLDEPTVRMAHQNPASAEAKQMMKNPAYSKGLELYKASIRESNLDEATDMNKIFNNLKKNSTVQIKFNSAVKKGADYQSFKVTAKNIVQKGKKSEQEKITLQSADNPNGVKYFLRKKATGNVTFAIGDMGASIVDMKETSGKALLKAYKEGNVECPKCDGAGCDHCDGRGYHVESKLGEAVGTSAKYARAKGVMGGKFTSNDKMAKMKNFSDIRKKKAAQRDAEHKAQDPKMAKMGYAKHMLDTDKARAKAAKRGITPTFRDYIAKNGLNKGKLPNAK